MGFTLSLVARVQAVSSHSFRNTASKPPVCAEHEIKRKLSANIPRGKRNMEVEIPRDSRLHAQG